MMPTFLGAIAYVRTMLRATRDVLVAAVLGVSSVVSAQLIEPQTAKERALVEAVSQRMSSCFTTLGPKRSFPVVSHLPPQEELFAAVLFRASGPWVSDGYNYILLLHRPSNAAFVVQLGGFATLRKVYGPLPLDTQCEGPAPYGPSQASSTTGQGP